jgi:hypothetical protein
MRSANFSFLTLGLVLSATACGITMRAGKDRLLEAIERELSTRGDFP